MPHTGLAISRDLANFTTPTGCMRSICRPLTSCTSALGGRLTTLDHPPTQLDPPEPARLPRAAPRTGIPQRGLRACHGSGESSLEAAWPPPVAPPQPPNTASARPQHPREQPRHRRRSSAHGATCQHSERACERLDQGQGEGRFELRGALTRRCTACFRPRRPPGTPRGANPAGTAPRRVGRRKDSCWTAHRMSRPTALSFNRRVSKPCA